MTALTRENVFGEETAESYTCLRRKPPVRLIPASLQLNNNEIAAQHTLTVTLADVPAASPYGINVKTSLLSRIPA